MPHLDNCVRCHSTVGGKDRKVDFSVASGGVVCRRHHDDTVILLSPQTVRAIKGVYTSGETPISQDTVEEIESILTDYMYVHLGNLNLNSLKHLK